MKAVNPATGQVLREYQEPSLSQVREILDGAERAFTLWRRTSIAERCGILRAAAAVLRDHRDRYARLMTQEMGKPITQATGEIEKCAWVCDYYAEHAADFLKPRPMETTDDADSYVRFDPLGPVLAIMPWNFPFWQVFRFAAPALAAGNVGLLKHATNVPGCALAVQAIFREAGAPEGVFTTLLLPSKKLKAVIDSPTIRAVTLTGSERAGKVVAAQAGEQIKKTVLELGGSDPFIVLGDADVAHAAEMAAKARTINSGQSCIAAKRFIVERCIVDDFTEAFVANMNSLKVGDPLREETDVGPLAREDLRDKLHDQVVRTAKSGATVLAGGKPIEGDGYYYPPTVLAHAQPGTPAFDEETFGPVAAVIVAEDADDALQLANRSQYGLGASVWTGDSAKADYFAAELQAGCVFVNQIVQSDPRVPFGGVKLSGYGRELCDYGIREFTNIKTVWIESTRTAEDVIQEASEESFPASDPPAWTL